MRALADWLASLVGPWIDTYARSGAAETIVLFLHLGGMLAAGGLAFTMDRAVLRSHRRGLPRRRDLARELHSSHTVVLAGLGVVALSGAALTLSDPTVFLVSWIYWAKMAAVVLLLANGWLLRRSGERLLADPADEGAFTALRRAAVRSGALWTLAVLGGVAITVYA